MKKFLIQFIIFLVLFFGSWYLISRIPFTTAINFKKLSSKNESNLGDKFIDVLRNSNSEITTDSVVLQIRLIKNRLCTANSIDPAKIEIYIFKNKDINAFAIPGNKLVIYTGLIEFCKNPEELSAVVAHEIAHIEKHHVTIKLSKEIGIGLLTTLATGNTGSTIIKETLKLLSSTAFDRNMEREADHLAIHYLANAHIDPEHFADMMLRLVKQTDLPESIKWLNTHPNSSERAKEILLEKKKLKINVVPLMPDNTWTQLQKDISN